MFITFGAIKLWLQADEIGITQIDFVNEKPEETPLSTQQLTHLTLAKEELSAYFSGDLVDFTVPIHFLKGTKFQRRVWDALTRIPYGEIRSYQDIAVMANSPRAQQAVGQANRMNPIPIIIPCHRIIGKNGKLVGYSGNSEEGLKTKQFLLDLEQKNKEL